MHRQDQDRDATKFTAHSAQRFQAIQLRHGDIQHHDVHAGNATEGPDTIQRALPIGSLANHYKVGLIFDQFSDACSKNYVIIC